MLNNYAHLSFQARWTLDGDTQNLIGQCQTWVEAMLGTPIRPDFRQRLLTLSLARGAQATTAIEGNTLSSAEVEAIQAGKRLSDSKGYLEQEVRNILVVFNSLMDELIIQKRDELITPELIKRMHHMVGEGLGEAFRATPGELRRSNVYVGDYRPPSCDEVESLVSRLCEWLDHEFHFQRGQDFAIAVVESIVAHVYLEWIHPFGDGNGRTGRLLEFYILMRSGLPNIASHLLSNHYNLTRAEYYRQISDAASANDLSAFIAYAMRGLRDGLQTPAFSRATYRYRRGGSCEGCRFTFNACCTLAMSDQDRGEGMP